MSSSILGKRTRALINTDKSASQSKRRAPFVIAADQENHNSFLTPLKSKQKAGKNGVEKMQVDAAGNENAPLSSNKTKRDSVTVPAKHGIVQSRVAVDVPSTAPAKSHGTTSSTPTTPRHRDAIRQKVQVTPRHRVGLVGKPLTPQTPRTPATPRSVAPSIYNKARQLFSRSGQHGEIIGRSNEKLEIGNFISTRLENTTSGCMYVSGPPGTGKSALIGEICQEFQDVDACCQGFINCIGIKRAQDIFIKLFEDFSANDGILRGNEANSLEQIFFARQTSYLVVLDEIDHLLDVDLDLLYSLFEWSMDDRSSLIVIGIANALDFTDRFMPKLKSRALKPQLLPFMPYSGPQIAGIITGKLKSLLGDSKDAGHLPILHPTAVLFLSKKVAATGDLRRAFDICRRVIDLIESEARDSEMRKSAEADSEVTPASTPTRTPLSENINLSSPSLMRSPAKSLSLSPKKVRANPLAQYTAENAPRATIAHMARVTSSMFSSGATQRLQGLNLQQKSVLCALVGLEERNRQRPIAEAEPRTPSKRGRGHGAAAPSYKMLFDLYTSACRKDNVLHPLTFTEFGDVVGGLETLSLLSAVEGKSGSFQTSSPAGTPSRRGRGKGFGALTGVKAGEERRIASSVGMTEVKNMVQETRIGRAILGGFLEGN